MSIYIREEIVCYVVSDILTVFVDNMLRQVIDWNKLTMNQSICVRCLTLLSVINHNIANSDRVALNSVAVRLTLRNDHRKYNSGILPGGSHREKEIIHGRFL